MNPQSSIPNSQFAIRPPLVSVLMASYNYEVYLGQALDSLLAQSYPHFEAIVCDDGSTDGSQAVVARYAERDARIQLIAQDNGGVASALNTAYAACRGDIVALLDADDFFAPDKLERVVACFQHHAESGLVLHAMQVVDTQARALQTLASGDAREQGWIAETVRARGGRWRSMPTSALAFRRSVAERLFPIPEPAFRSEADGFLVTLAALLTEVARLPEVLASYRLHGANLTGTLHLNQTVTERRLDALRRTNEAVNQRLTELGMAERHFALEDNLNFHEQAFMQALFAGAPRRALLRAYSRLARVLLADDLYGVLRKMVGLVANGAAIVLPLRARASWLSALLYATGPRQMIEALQRRRSG